MTPVGNLQGWRGTERGGTKIRPCGVKGHNGQGLKLRKKSQAEGGGAEGGKREKGLIEERLNQWLKRARQKRCNRKKKKRSRCTAMEKGGNLCERQQKRG